MLTMCFSFELLLLFVPPARNSSPMEDVTNEFAAHWIQKNRSGLLKLLENEYPKSMRGTLFFGIQSWLQNYGKKWYCLWLN